MVPRTARRRPPRRSEIRRARRKRRVLFALLAVLAIGIPLSVFAAREDAVADGPAKGKLLLDESFDGNDLDLDRWSPCYHWAYIGCTNLSNNELQWYLPSQVEVSDGRLSLVADARTVVGLDDREFDFVSGLISGLSPDQKLFAFKYGYVEARVRLPAGRGLWSALWMLPTTRESEPEIDIFETVGEKPELVTMHTHWLEDGKERQQGHKFRTEDMTLGWHTFGLEWKPDSLTFYVDDVARWRVTDPKQIPNEEMYLIANLAVGGRFTKSPDETTPFPASLQFDYIRVWEAP